MKIGIMQPYFLPYLGYFQLINAVDQFLIYDKIKYTKKGWINRNRISVNKQSAHISIPLSHANDDSKINERTISPTFDRQKLIRRISSAYRKAPFWHETMPIIENAISSSEQNLFLFLEHCLRTISTHLGISTPIHATSELEQPNNLAGESRVIALCRQSGANTYINLPGGFSLYSSEKFRENGLELLFLNPKITPYNQGHTPFVPNLSIVDVLMHNSIHTIANMLSTEYELI